MANIKKSRGQKKKTVSFSVKTRHIEQFRDICEDEKLVFSNTLEELIINFNNKYSDGE